MSRLIVHNITGGGGVERRREGKTKQAQNQPTKNSNHKTPHADLWISTEYYLAARQYLNSEVVN